jgi:hypothetical protein
MDMESRGKEERFVRRRQQAREWDTDQLIRGHPERQRRHFRLETVDRKPLDY